MPKDAPGDFNQSLMELGALICIPNGIAQCGECPLAELCLARKHDRVMELPKKAEKKQRRLEKRTVLLIQDGKLLPYASGRKKACWPVCTNLPIWKVTRARKRFWSMSGTVLRLSHPAAVTGKAYILSCGVGDGGVPGTDRAQG